MVDRVMHSSNSKEWETPKNLFHFLADEFAGGEFDLDPVATEKNALCEKFFTEKEDGLRQEWFGKVFVNPPYGKGRLTEKWVEKMLVETSLKSVDVIVGLLPARTETVWFDDVFKYCTLLGRIEQTKEGFKLSKKALIDGRKSRKKMRTEIYFVERRVKFDSPEERKIREIDPSKKLAGAPFPSVIVVFKPGA